MDFKAYENTSESKVRELKYFRTKYGYKEIFVDNIRWEYILSKGTGKTLILLPSGVHFGEMWFEVINRLEGKYTIIAPSFPVMSSMKDALKGILAIIDKHVMDKAAVVGMSTSGWIAQCFVREYKERVSKLMLTNTSLPDKALIGAVNEAVKKTESNHLDHIRKGLQKFYLNMDMPEQEKKFYRIFLSELLLKTSKELVLGLYKLTYDYMSNYQFAQNDLAGWNGDILIIESDNENGYDTNAENAMKKLYRDAQIYRFQNAGHAPLFSRTDEFIRVVDEFVGR